MIQPEHIRRKAQNLYPEFLRAWLEGKPFFPKTIPARKKPEDDLAATIEAVQRLREGSKSVRGCGYTVEWTRKNSRKYGRNLFPKRILFETQEDFLRYIRMEREFSFFAGSVTKIRARYPQLEPWIRSNCKLLIDSVREVDGLLLVVDYLRENPRPNQFARELPLPVDTKFVERNRHILRTWLDLALPPHTIRADEEHFERRYGLRYPEPHILVRFLDANVQRQCEVPWPECSIPLHTLAEMELKTEHALIVENKVTLLTLPPIAGAVALGGLGNSVTDLSYLRWLNKCLLWYWGDLDPDGFMILSRLRAVFPNVRSLLMEEETIHEWRNKIPTSETVRSLNSPPGLRNSERAALNLCLEQNLRIEQERFPHDFVVRFLRRKIRGKGIFSG